MPPNQSDELKEKQRNVLGKLGECSYRLQQYELLLKQVVARVKLVAPVDDFHRHFEQNKSCINGKTVGTLIGMLKTNCIANDGETAGFPADGKSWMGIRFWLDISQEERQETIASLSAFVDLRNSLVHHFAEQYKLQTLENCSAALAFLSACGEQIDSQISYLEQLAAAIHEGMSRVRQHMDDPGIMHLLLTGVYPDGSFEWPSSGAVRVLLGAELLLAVDGWTRVNDAAAWGRETNPLVVPGLYGCKTWRQVIHESQMFAVRHEAEPHTGRGVMWYRSK